MRHFALGLLAVIPFASCTSGPAAAGAAAAPFLGPSGTEGSVTAGAVITDRIRLRTVPGADIVTSLVDGQVVDIPINVTVDIWAEIRRLESDRARLVVDWGNGNSDFTGCGACRLENRYTQEGRFAVVAKVIDLNAPAGPPVIAVALTLRVFDPKRVPESPSPSPSPTPIPCVAVSGGDFEAAPQGSYPVRIPGATISGPSVRLEQPSYVNSGNMITSGDPVTITFDTDQARMTMDWIHPSVAAIGFEAFDAAGNMVATGSQPFTRFAVVGWRAGTGVVSGVRFRKVILYGPYYFDNLTASCN